MCLRQQFHTRSVITPDSEVDGTIASSVGQPGAGPALDECLDAVGVPVLTREMNGGILLSILSVHVGSSFR